MDFFHKQFFEDGIKMVALFSGGVIRGLKLRKIIDAIHCSLIAMFLLLSLS